MKRLLLIDAYAMIYRAYYAMIKNPRINSKGVNTSTMFGFVNTIEDLLRRVDPTHLAVVFDPHGPTFRHEAYPEYKAQREETPEDIRIAVPYIMQILKAMNIQVYQLAGYEADDVVGTLAVRAEQEGFDTYMATPDKDYGQLTSEHIFMYKPGFKGGWEKYDSAAICEKYGLQNKDQVIDLLALMGDKADNVPGCPGVGEKTAVKLIEQFGSVEQMLKHADEIKGALQQKVRDSAEQIRFSRFLVTIKTDVPMEWKETELERKEVNKEALIEVYRELEFRSFLSKLEGVSVDANAANTSQKTGGTKKAQPEATQLSLFDAFEASTQAAQAAPEKAATVKKMNRQQVETDETAIRAQLAHYLLQPELRHDIPYLLDIYQCTDAQALLELFMPQLEAQELMPLFEQVEVPLVPVLNSMEQLGVRIDTEALRLSSQELTAQMNQLEQEALALAGMSFNINSARQIGEVLFDHLQLDAKAKKTKTGQYVTSEDVLEKLKDKHPIVGKILEYRQLKKLISTYIDALPKLINPETGRVHTHYNQMVTATGRLSSSDPNLQNIPVRSDLGKEIRKAFIPDDGCVFLSADYSQIELRLMAHFSEDEHLIEAFRSGYDIHTATAAHINHIAIEDVTPDMRRAAKTANFGIIYGISAFGLAERLGCSRHEAKALIDGYFETYPAVKEFINRSIHEAQETGYVKTLMNRRRYLPDINSHNSIVRGYAERNAVNAPLQGTAADIIKIAMVRIWERMQKEGLKSKMILQVHDELNFSVPTDELEQMKQLVSEEMAVAMELRVPLVAECGVGQNWLEAH